MLLAALPAPRVNHSCKAAPATHRLASPSPPNTFTTSTPPGYALGQVPSNIALLRLGAPAWLATICGAWAICAGAFAFVRSAAGFVALRLLLGLCEVGAAAGVSTGSKARSFAAAALRLLPAADLNVAAHRGLPWCSYQFELASPMCLGAQAGSIPGVWAYVAQMWRPERTTLPLVVIETGEQHSSVAPHRRRGPRRRWRQLLSFRSAAASVIPQSLHSREADCADNPPPDDPNPFPGITVSQVLGAPLAAGLLALDGAGGLKGWQWVSGRALRSRACWFVLC